MGHSNEILACARAAHEANLAYCAAIGDHSQLPWEQAPEWQRESAIAGVGGVMAGNSPEQQHQAWCDDKAQHGWVYGPAKNSDTKTHPCLVPYGQLPPEQQAKDGLFVGVVMTMVRSLNGRER